MTVTRSRCLFFSAMAFLPPSWASLSVVARVSTAVLKTVGSTGGAGNAGLPGRRVATVRQNDTKSASPSFVNKSDTSRCLILDIVLDIVSPLLDVRTRSISCSRRTQGIRHGLCLSELDRPNHVSNHLRSPNVGDSRVPAHLGAAWLPNEPRGKSRSPKLPLV